jgi:erythromycin esterase-like protein
MRKVFIICCLLIFQSGFAQLPYTSWLNTHVHPIAADTTSNHDDLAFLALALQHNLVIGLGEASHGTHEFYLQKNRIIKFLVTSLHYKNLGFEFSNSVVEPINDYLVTGKGDLKNLMSGLALYETEEIYALFQWLAHYNKNQLPENKVTLFGFDRDDSWNDVLAREKLMAQNIVKHQQANPNKTMIWAHNIHIAKDTTMAEVKAVGTYLKEAFGRQYYALGFDTYKGSVQVLADGQFEEHTFQTADSSLSAIFATAELERFFVDFDKGEQPFKTKLPMTHINSNWTESRTLPVRPGLDFNAILFIRETTPSRKLAR